ncbi:MAG: 30S ribosomal protein S6 [Acidimicrobiia bacterium]|nr:30S ribosomal protein S6 [Acidimicrobiia bacterium]
MRAYEMMVIYDADQDDAGIQNSLNRITELIQGDGGRVANTERWGRRKFSHEIKKRNEGYYVILEIVTPAAGMPEVERILRIADGVVRHKVLRLPDAEATRRGLLGAEPATSGA